jgi:hypothetical protein
MRFPCRSFGVSLILLCGCKALDQSEKDSQDFDPLIYVDPLIGSVGGGKLEILGLYSMCD